MERNGGENFQKSNIQKTLELSLSIEILNYKTSLAALMLIYMNGSKYTGSG